MDDFLENERTTTKLSRNLMQMKFMQRSVFRIEREKHEEESKLIDDEHWVLDLPELQQRECRYIVEPSYDVCASLTFGRMSYGGMNPVIEKLMKATNQDIELQAATDRENAVMVTEHEMTERYENLIGTISKKFQTKRQRAEMEEQVESASVRTQQLTNKIEDFLKQQRTETEHIDSLTKKMKKSHQKKFLKPPGDD